jgi:hypothetical protein
MRGLVFASNFKISQSQFSYVSSYGNMQKRALGHKVFKNYNASTFSQLIAIKKLVIGYNRGLLVLGFKIGFKCS